MEQTTLPIKTKIVAWVMTVIGAIGLTASLLILCLMLIDSNPANDIGLFFYLSIPVSVLFFPGIMVLFKKGLGWWFSVLILSLFIIWILFSTINGFFLRIKYCERGDFSTYSLEDEARVCSKEYYLISESRGALILCIIISIPLILLLIDRKFFWNIASQPKWWWYILFGLIGGIVGYIKIKDKDKKIAKRVLIGGILFNVLILLIIIIVGVYLFRWDISFISDPIRNFIYEDRYTTYSDGVIIEYPASWYRKISRVDILSLNLYPTSNPHKQLEMNVNVWDETRIFNRSRIYDTSPAIEYYLGRMKEMRPGFELIMKDLKENIGLAEFKDILEGSDKVYYTYYKIVKCDERIYKLTFQAEESNNFKYSTDISRIINSFQCR
jgi:hypothetical protein